MAKDAILDEGGAVVAVEAAVSADPKDAGPVLEQTKDGVVAQTVFNREPGKGGARGSGEEAA